MVHINQDGFFDDITSAFAAEDPHVEQKTLETERVRCVQLLYHAIARGAFAETLQLTTADFSFEVVGPGASKLVGKWVGHGDVIAALQRNFSHFSDQSPKIETVVAQGNIVVVIARESGKLVPSGAAYHVVWIHEFTFAGDHIAKVRQIFDGVEGFSSADLP